MRLRRADCGGEGLTRRRRGKGFSYHHPDGTKVADPELLERVRELVIPPAWDDVWICPWPNGHIQATGVDDAGRKQYLYHEQWTRRRSLEKFDAMLGFSRSLPKLRRRVAADLDEAEPGRQRALALAVRLLDVGFFRIGGEQYAEENGTYGIATILKRHVTLTGERGLTFEYPGKASLERVQTVDDAKARRAAEPLLRRRTGPAEFLAFHEGRSWAGVGSDEINGYIQAVTGPDHSAKDFRTWNGTVLAAVELAASPPPDSARGRDREIAAAIERVADRLGNTPAVCRSSYVDPRVVECYRQGTTIELPSRPPTGTAGPARMRLEKQVREVIESCR